MFLLFSVLLTAIGCSQPAEPEAKQVTAKMPANFPDDFPIYPKSKVVISDWSMTRSGRTILRVKWQGPGLVGEALEFYDRELEANQWDKSFDQDLQTKVLSIWRRNQQHKEASRLVIAPLDPSEAKDGVFIAVELIL